MVLLFARPFRVGDRVRFRAGALGGSLEGTVTDISITYVRLETADGVVFVPNSQALAAAWGRCRRRAPAEPGPAPPAAGRAGPAATLPVDQPRWRPRRRRRARRPWRRRVVPSDSRRTWQSPAPESGPDHSP